MFAGIVGRADVMAAIFSGFAFLAYSRSVPRDEVRPIEFSAGTHATWTYIGQLFMAMVRRADPQVPWLDAAGHYFQG